VRAQTALIVGGGALAIGLVLYAWQKGFLGIAKSAGKAAGDLVGGTVVGVGSAIGIPETNMNECQKALAEGRYWDASFVCPAGTLIKGFFGDTPAPIAAAPTAAVPSSTGTASVTPYSAAPDLSALSPVGAMGFPTFAGGANWGGAQ